MKHSISYFFVFNNLVLSVLSDLMNLILILQVKFSELTIDMFRMLQTLEREPQEDVTQIYDASPAPGKMPFVSC